jgi:1-acyl-sn-glycerol-3-phosphate acyltransferase
MHHKPYKTPADQAFPDVKTPEPAVSKPVVFIIRFLFRIYWLLFIGFAKVVVRGNEHLFNSFKKTLAGESRCIIAFRHPHGCEPQLIICFCLYMLKALAAGKGVKFARPPHALSVYGYEVVRWGGWVSRFVLPRVGAMPVHHAKMDSRGMARINKALLDGPYPLALAPEGQVSYNADSVPRLEPGAVRIGFGAAEKLAGTPLEILPVSVHFRYGAWGKFALERLLKKIEKITGRGGTKNFPFNGRLTACREHIIEVNEKKYNLKNGPSLPFGERLDALAHAALETAERALGINPSGEFFARLYHLRQICWDRLFLPGMDKDGMDSLTGVERGVADLFAGEAWYVIRHLELADISWYFRVPLPAEDAPLHQKIEYVQNLWDFANRSMGGDFNDRIVIFPKRVIIHAAPPINLTERLPSYKEDKKAAVRKAMADLTQTYLDCINEINNEPEF